MALIRRAAERIRNGSLVVFPTHGLYGIGAAIDQPAALARVFYAKKRPPDQPIAILIRGESLLTEFAADIPPSAVRLMRRFWPGRITLVFRAKSSVPTQLIGQTGKIGIRVPAHPVAAALLNCLDGPITGTSANLSGQPGCYDISDLAPQVMAEMALILDVGPLSGGAGSTVVDVSASRPLVLREGAVPEAEIRSCTGS